jgi:signal peptide peptidase SppA
MKRKKKMNDLRGISKHWAMEPDSLKNLYSNVREQNSLSFFSERQLPNTNSVLVRGRTAIIPIKGVITPRMDFFTAFFGGTALDVLAKDLQEALDNEEIDNILFDIDSPGGVAVGPSEMAEMIFKAREKKTIWSYVGRNCCSAAYWLASATEKIVTHKSSILGSIGVISTHPIQEQPNMQGYKNIQIVSSNAKNKKLDPRTPEGLEEIKKELDSLEDEFIGSIAKYRSLTTDYIKSNFGQGGVFIGSQAININMADELGSYESVLQSLSAKEQMFRQKGEQSMSEKQNAITKENISAEFLKKECPEIVESFKSEGFEAGKKAGFEDGKISGIAEGKQAERDRILALDKVALSGHEDLIAEAKSDSEMTAEKLALKIIEAEKAKGNNYVESLKNAEKAMPVISHDSKANIKDEDDDSDVDENSSSEEKAEAQWNKDSKIRAEFNNDKEAFFAYFNANENGQVKIK